MFVIFFLDSSWSASAFQIFSYENVQKKCYNRKESKDSEFTIWFLRDVQRIIGSETSLRRVFYFQEHEEGSVVPSTPIYYEELLFFFPFRIKFCLYAQNCTSFQITTYGSTLLSGVGSWCKCRFLTLKQTPDCRRCCCCFCYFFNAVGTRFGTDQLDT